MRNRYPLSSAVIILLLSGLCQAQQSARDISPAAFAQLPGFVGAKISPDGKHLAYLYPAGERWSLVIHRFSDADEMRIPPGDELDYDWLRWANDSTLVISMSYNARREFTETVETRLLAFDLNSDKITPLVKPAQVKGDINSRISVRDLPPPQLQDDVIGWMPEDPQHILVCLDENQDANYEVRKIDVTTGEYDIVRNSATGIQNWMADVSGEVRFGYGFDNSDFNARLKMENGKWRALRRMDWYLADWFPQGYTEDSSKVYAIGPGKHGTREVRVLNTNNGRFEETLFSNEMYDVGDLVKHPVTGHIAGVVYTEHRKSFRYFDKELDRLQRSVDRLFADATNSMTSMTSDMRRIVVESSSDTNPGVVYIWDRDLKTIEPFGAKMPQIDPSLMRPVEAVEYVGADGAVVPAYLTRPADSGHGRLPAIVLPHGGPTARDDQSFWFLSQFLVSRGYAVLQPNFRGSEGYGYEYKNAGKQQWGGLMQDDVTAGVNWLVEQGIADNERICIVGWSYGGYAAAMGLVKTPELYQCGVSINGVLNLPLLIANDKDYVGGSVWTKHMGLDGEGARSVSPYHQIERMQAPLLIVHADDDERVDFGQAKSMHKKMKKKKRQSELVKLPRGGHGVFDRSSRLTMLESIEEFLAANIGGS